MSIGQTITETLRFSGFQDGGHPVVSYKFESFRASHVQKVTLRHLAKFRRDRSKLCRDMAIFRFFFKMAAIRHLGFVVCAFGTTQREHLVVFITVQNLLVIDAVVSTT